MSPKQVADLLVGIAEAQAALLTAITETFEKNAVVSEAKQAAARKLYALQGGQNKKPITFEVLPAKLLQTALAPGSHAGKTIHQTALAEVERLLTQPQV